MSDTPFVLIPDPPPMHPEPDSGHRQQAPADAEESGENTPETPELVTDGTGFWRADHPVQSLKARPTYDTLEKRLRESVPFEVYQEACRKVDALTVRLEGSQTRGGMVLDAKNEWAERARKAEARVRELEAACVAKDAALRRCRSGLENLSDYHGFPRSETDAEKGMIDAALSPSASGWLNPEEAERLRKELDDVRRDRIALLNRVPGLRVGGEGLDYIAAIHRADAAEVERDEARAERDSLSGIVEALREEREQIREAHRDYVQELNEKLDQTHTVRCQACGATRAPNHPCVACDRKARQIAATAPPAQKEPSGDGEVATRTPDAPEAKCGDLADPRWAEVVRCVDAFRAVMLEKLAANRHKGDRTGWRGDLPRRLIERVREETSELWDALLHAPGETFDRDVVREAADVANMAMMVADAAGALDVPPESAGGGR